MFDSIVHFVRADSLVFQANLYDKGKQRIQNLSLIHILASALACGQTEAPIEQWRCFLSAVISNLTLILVHCDLAPELEAISEEVEELAEEAERQS